MRFKLTLLLLVLNAALAGFILYLDRVQSTRHLQDASSRLLLDAAFVQQIDHILITSAFAPHPWELKREGQTWTVTSPFHWKANPFAVQQLLFQLRRLAWDSRFPVQELAASGQTLDSYALATPPVHIVLGAGDSAHSLSLGSPTEIGNRLYLMSPPSDFIYVVPRSLLDTLNRDLEAFLDRRIFTLDSEETEALQIQDRAASNVRVRLERQEQRWQFVSPIETAADPDRVRSLLAEWQGLEVVQFVPDRAISLAMDGNSLRLTLEGLGERETLILTPPTDADPPGPYFLARREAYPAVFQVRADLIEDLRSAQENLRERRVLKDLEGEWTSLKIDFGNRGLTLQKLENGVWQVLYTDQAGALRTLPASTEVIQNLKSTLLSTEAERFITDAPSEADFLRFDLTEPQRRLRIRTSLGQESELLIGGLHPDEDQTLLYATTSRSDSVFLVRPHLLPLLSLDPTAFRDRLIRSLPDSAAIQEVLLIHRLSGLPIALAQPGPLPDGETTLESDLRRFFRQVRVERFLNRPFQDPMPLGRDLEIDWPFILEARVSLPPEGNPETIRLFLSERLGGTTQYVADPLSGLVGTLPIPLIEKLDPFLVRPPQNPAGPPPSSPGPLDQGTPED